MIKAPPIPPTKNHAAPAKCQLASRQKVLLLEDDDDFREALEGYLTIRDFDVSAVPNGAAGIKEIVREPFDLIICDMMMPEVGGEMFYWATTRVRPAARFRFLFVTGHQNNPTVKAFFTRINANVLVKPFSLEDLTARIVQIQRMMK